MYSIFKDSAALGSWLQGCPSFVSDRQWNVLQEAPGLGRGPDDTFQEEVAQALFKNEGGYVAGQGGVGKSYVLKLVKQKFEEAKYIVDVIAFTHVQASNVDGITVLHHLHRKIKTKGHVIIVDESSQVPLRLWAALACLKFTGSRFIVLGDVDGQLPPICDQHRLDQWAKVDKSRFMHDLCNGLRVEMRKFRRGTDQAHFDFVGSLYPRMKVSLEDAVRLARRTYPVRRHITQVQTVLCVTNKCRKVINDKLNSHNAAADAVFVKYDGNNEAAQDMHLWPGLVLHSCITDRKHLQNALRYMIKTVDKSQTALVKVNDTNEEIGQTFVLDTSEVPAKLRLSHAITIDNSQARTIYGNVRVIQTDHAHFSLRRLIVALGRVPDASQLEVE